MVSLLILAFQEPCPCTAVTFGSILFVVTVVLVFVMACLDYIVKRVSHISSIVAPVRRKSNSLRTCATFFRRSKLLTRPILACR